MQSGNLNRILALTSLAISVPLGIDWIAGAGPHWAGFPLRAILSGAAILLACCTLWLTARATGAPAAAGDPRAGAKPVTPTAEPASPDVTALKSIQRRNAEFVSAVSHEMKTPLAGIKAYVELLADGDAEDAETQEEFLSVINSQVIRLQRLVDSVLNLARIEAGVANVSKEGHLLNDLLGESLSAVRRAAEQKQIELVNELIPLESKVLVDHGMIVQAATNLLANAINYTPPGGTVVLRSWQAGDEVRFEVKDSGVGLSADDCARVFEKFYRVHKDKDMAAGTGLGLPLAKHIVEDVHGGRLSISSVLGQGSVFSVTLPAADSEFAALTTGVCHA